MKSENVFRNVCIALFIGTFIGIMIFGTLEYVSAGEGEGLNYTIQ